jgi:hypothetical protein
MKFLNVYCENRKTQVYINLDKIVMVTKTEGEDVCQIELESRNETPVKVGMNAEDLIRKINGEDRMGIGFRRSI